MTTAAAGVTDDGTCDPARPACPATTFCSSEPDVGPRCRSLCSSDSDCAATGGSCNDAYLPDGGSGPQVCGS